ncbi:MAG: MATE family efflux transporter, partial [Rhizorhabdus sp.]
MEELPDSQRLWRAEARALLSLSLPLIVGNLGWSAVSATDLLLLGQLGADAVAAGSLALNLYNALLIFGMGLTAAASPLIASERGRRLHAVRDIRRTVRQTIWIGALFCLPCWLLLWQAEPILILIGQDPILSAQAAELLHGLQWALFPYLVYLTLRNFMGAVERPIWG